MNEASIESKIKKTQSEAGIETSNLKTFPITNGTGAITISHITLYGTDTIFKEELNAGDALILEDP